MTQKEWEPENLLDVFGDALARRILVLTSERPMSAEELTDQLEVSPPTIYRRVNTLSGYDLITERIEINEDGNHYKTFETTLQEITFAIEDGGYTIDVQIRRSLVDQFEAFWSDLEDSGTWISPEPDDQSDSDRVRGGARHE